MSTAPFLEKCRNLGRFFHQVGRLAAPYFASDEKVKAWGLLAAIVALNLGTVYIAVLFNDWNRLFYDALQEKNATVYWAQLGRFTYLAFAMIVVVVYKFYLTQMLELRWRQWMTNRTLKRWTEHHAFYQLELARFNSNHDTSSATIANPPDNPDQRIAQDIRLFTTQSVDLSMGLLNAMVTLVSFVGILWGLSGPFSFSLGGQVIDIPGYMVWMALIYCLVGSVLSHYIGRPLIELNFQQEKVEANFRHHLVRVREYSEAIALDRGGPVERGQLNLRFGDVLANYLSVIKAQKRLIWFQSFFGQAAIIFPFLVAAPRFFSGAIQLGQLMQISSAFGKVQDSLSWFVDNYDSLASWRATTNRLISFDDSLSQIEAAPPVTIEDSSSVSATDLQLALPNGEPLLNAASLVLSPGDTVLVKGASGSGKSTLLRAFAGIWPFTRGRLAMPADCMFIPQKPYIGQGSLRAALAYPERSDHYTEAALKQALRDAFLPHLVEQLDREDAWSQKLSGGEQQRLAIARVFLKQPRWLFADEATSALDLPTQAAVYQRLVAMVKANGGALVSISHQPEIAQWHQTTWRIQDQRIQTVST
jgi:putative ATP-binding cassette transporter